MISVFSTEEEKTYSVHIQNTEVVPDAPFFKGLPSARYHVAEGQRAGDKTSYNQ